MLLERLAEPVRHLVAVAMTLAHLGFIVRPCRTSARRYATHVCAQAHGSAHVLHLLLLFHERYDRVRTIRRELAGVAVLDPSHVAGELDDGRLHAEADAEERKLRLTGDTTGFHHSVHAPHPAATGHQQAVVLGQDLASDFRRGEPVAGDPPDLHPNIVPDAAVDERFLHALVAVNEVRVLAHDGHLHRAARRHDLPDHVAPARE